MIKLSLYRFRSDDYATLGELRDAQGGHLFYTMELPWKDNKSNVSCVPDGLYSTEWYDSPTKGRGRVLQLVDVLGGRKYCQFHAGNFPYNFKGCVGLGTSIQMIMSKKYKKRLMGIGASSSALKDFKSKFMDKKIIMKIRTL